MQHNSTLTYWKTAVISVLYVVDLQNVGFRLDSFGFGRFSRIICRFSTCIVVCRITVFPNRYFLWQGFICVLYNNHKLSGTALFRNGDGWNWYSNPWNINPLNPEFNPICYLLALLGAHYFLHVSRIRVKSLTFRLLMSYIYGAPILDVSRSHTTTQHSR